MDVKNRSEEEIREAIDGVGIFKDVIIPHTQKKKYFERIKKTTEKLKSKGHKVHQLTDDNVLFFDGNSSVIL